MARVVRSNAREWCSAIQTQLVLTTSLATDQVRVVIQTDPPMAQTQDILIRPGGFVNRREVSLGGGRVNTVLDRRLYIVVRTILGLDDVGDDTQLVTHSTLGHLNLEDLVLDSLVDFIPLNADGDALTVEPLELMQSTDSERDTHKTNITQSQLTFSVAYAPVLNQARQ